MPSLEKKIHLAELLNEQQAASPADAEAIAEIAWRAGLNWSDTSGWVIPGDE